MKPLTLLQNACTNFMFIKITNVTVSDETIQYSYIQGNNNYYLRINKYTLSSGFIAKDGKSYASGLPIQVIRYLIDNFDKVVYEIQE
jgi:hypothetical protein